MPTVTMDARSPFPGMDPFLESPAIWPDVHSRLMNAIAELLAPLIAPKYIAELDTQVVLSREDPSAAGFEYALPDIAVAQVRESPAVDVPPPAAMPLRLRIPLAVPTRLTRLHVRLREDDRLVLVIELLSPVNKRPGQGRQAYLEKRDSYLSAQVHLVEIDLLRTGPRMPVEAAPACDYLILVSNFYERPNCDVWPISVRQRLPDLQLPLLKPDGPVLLELSEALRLTYARARYDLRVNYRESPTPPLAEADATWAAALVASRVGG